ncbi:MAG TPA: hypothetical protein VGY99_00645 [Candidatus Binataceae bacterium]|jgi:hypothetical protein|nr:hypothetical protein [Candidatus Binataceae bacterium]
MLRRRALLLLIAAGIGACSWFHHPTPQQQMLDALNHGNAAQASNIWQQMSQKDRMKFNRGQGFTPAVPPEQVMKTLTEMSPDDAQGPITIKPPGAGATLLDLPQIAHPQTAAPAPPPEPPASEPAAEQP